LKAQVIEAIAKVVEHPFVLEKHKDPNFGHYAVPVFPLAKILRKSPAIIAKEIADKFDNESLFSKVEAVGGYVNFTLSDTWLDKFATMQLFILVCLQRAIRRVESYWNM